MDAHEACPFQALRHGGQGGAVQDGFALTVQLHIVARCLHPSDVGQGHEAALFGYARRYIRRGSPLLTMLTEAVFPFYIVHQTAIVLAGHWLKPLGLPSWSKPGPSWPRPWQPAWAPMASRERFPG